MRIKITQEILERSKMCGIGTDVGFNCAISLAIRDVFPNSFVDISNNSLNLKI